MSTPAASKLLTNAAAALARGNAEQAGALIEQALDIEPRIRRAARKAPRTIEELKPLLRRKDAAGPVMRELRLSLGLTLHQAAEICGVSTASAGCWEVGRSVISEAALSRLLVYLADRGAEKFGDAPSPEAFEKLRERLGFTRGAIGAKLGIKETVVLRIESGHMPAPISVIAGYRALAAEHGLDLAA